MRAAEQIILSNAEFAQAHNDFSAAVKLDWSFTIALAFGRANLTTGKRKKMYAKQKHLQVQAIKRMAKNYLRRSQMKRKNKRGGAC